MKSTALSVLLVLLLAGCDFDMRRISRAYTDYVTRDGGAWQETSTDTGGSPPMRLTFHKGPRPTWWFSHANHMVEYEGVWAWARKEYMSGRGHFEIAGGKEEPVTIAIDLVEHPYGPEDGAYLFIADTAGGTMRLTDRKGGQHVMQRSSGHEPN